MNQVKIERFLAHFPPTLNFADDSALHHQNSEGLGTSGFKMTKLCGHNQTIQMEVMICSVICLNALRDVGLW